MTYTGNILYCHPWHPEKGFGLAINELFRSTNYNWLCMNDADTMFTTKTFDAQIRSAIAENPNRYLYTCLTNRNGYMHSTRSQMAPDVDPANDNMRYHHVYGRMLAETNGHSCEVLDPNQPLSGAMILLHRSLWEVMNIPETPAVLGIDNLIHRQAVANGHHCYLLTGVYMYHWYRGGHRLDSKHLLP